MDFTRAAGSGKRGLELQHEYYKAAAEKYSWLNNSAQMYFDVFTAFREFSRTTSDGSMIENALDALQQAHLEYFGTSYGGESCRDSATEFLKDSPAYLPDRRKRHAEIVEVFGEKPEDIDPGKPMRDGLRDVIAETLISESKKHGSITAEEARSVLGTKIYTYLVSLPKEQATIDALENVQLAAGKKELAVILPAVRSKIECDAMGYTA